MDVSLPRHEHLASPWRTAALVAAAVAAVELLVLIVVGGALLVKPSSASTGSTSHRAAAAKHAAAARAVTRHRTATPVAELKRSRVKVIVLNGGSRQGAAATTAARASSRGYRIGGVANAPSSDFTRSLVMYRRGFEGEGRRLARDLGIGIVGPLDGMRVAQLHGAQAVVVIGG